MARDHAELSAIPVFISIRRVKLESACIHQLGKSPGCPITKLCLTRTARRVRLGSIDVRNPDLYPINPHGITIDYAIRSTASMADGEHSSRLNDCRAASEGSGQRKTDRCPEARDCCDNCGELEPAHFGIPQWCARNAGPRVKPRTFEWRQLCDWLGTRRSALRELALGVLALLRCHGGLFGALDELAFGITARRGCDGRGTGRNDGKRGQHGNKLLHIHPPIDSARRMAQGRTASSGRYHITGCISVGGGPLVRPRSAQRAGSDKLRA